MVIYKKGLVYWEGDLKYGKGIVLIESGVLSQQFYGFNICFEGVKGINFEELIGVVYVVCFLMVLLLMFSEEGYIVMFIDIIVVVIFNKIDGGFVIIDIVL